MSLILTGDIGPKVYYVEAVPAYLKRGAGRRFPIKLAAAMGLREAVKTGCDEIRVKADGLRSRAFSIREVEDHCRRDFRLWKYLPAPMHPHQALIGKYDRHLASGLYI